MTSNRKKEKFYKMMTVLMDESGRYHYAVPEFLFKLSGSKKKVLLGSIINNSARVLGFPETGGASSSTFSIIKNVKLSSPSNRKKK